ncbi:hypothetical protein EV580_1318 [Mycobacterium sp. BK086]|uniref:hypothetical protein n=1 Tax=Mycobacterium sp. BK086 TaxID=2512165 RepID=UPI00105C445D|nr:hypothetical protein [Mycobacterium sp. BK086]TDO18136.1 hypothetical protein EV580_1318 [Mycobacterium sp. BK086]
MSAPVDGMTDDARAAVDELLTLRGQPISLIPATGTVVEKPGGGKDYTPGAPRDPQIFAKFNKQALDGVENAQTDRGTTRKFRYEMVGAHDAVIEVGDSWEDYAAKYVVDSVDNSQPYQIKAIVIAFLKVTGHSYGA